MVVVGQDNTQEEDLLGIAVEELAVDTAVLVGKHLVEWVGMGVDQLVDMELDQVGGMAADQVDIGVGQVGTGVEQQVDMQLQ